MSSTVRTPLTITRAPWQSDSAAVVALWSQHLGGREQAARKVAHAYLENPAGAGQCLLALEGSPPQTVGALGLHARRYWRGHDTAEVCVMADFVVDPRQRTLGPALALMRAAVDTTRQQSLGLFGWPNERSAAVAQRAGVPAPLTMARYAKPLRSRLPLVRLQQAPRAPQSRWTRLQHQALSRLLPPLLPIVTPALDAMLSGHDRLQMLGKRASAALLRQEGSGAPMQATHSGAWQHVGGFADTLSGGRRAAENPNTGPAIDTLWAQRGAQWWLSDRSWPFLRWRFAQGRWQLSLWLDADGRAHGYVVWRMAPSAGSTTAAEGRSADDVVEIADALCNPLPRALAPMLRSFAHSMRSQTRAQLLSLEFGGCQTLAGQILEAGFVALGTPAPVLCTPPQAVPPGSWSPDGLFLTTLDRDPDL
jgi:hypothetical protein